MGDDILELRTREFQQLCKEMLAIMYQASGVGLAALQVGLSTRLFVYNHLGDPSYSKFERIVCNPKILEYCEEVDVEEEGCLSSRSGSCMGPVCRSVSIMVEYSTKEGSLVRRRLNGFEAWVFQHEYDHNARNNVTGTTNDDTNESIHPANKKLKKKRSFLRHLHPSCKCVNDLIGKIISPK